jgi:IS30 family transposase
MRKQVKEKVKFHHLNIDDREKIQKYFELGWSIYKISKKLNRSYPCVYYEIKNNQHKYNIKNNTYDLYISSLAQNRADFLKSYRKKPIILDTNEALRKELIKNLKKKISPERFSNITKQFNHPNDTNFHISYETIYKWLYSIKDIDKRKELTSFLIRKHIKRLHWFGRKPDKTHIIDRTSISKRPEEINDRKRFGDFEVDSVESPKKISKYAIHTIVERVSKRGFAYIVPCLKSGVCLEKQIELVNNLPKGIVKSFTFDNGKENHLHYKLKNDYGIDTYFCHPYSPYEKGQVENFNMLLRRYFPKGTDFSKITQAELNEAVNEINNSPMKCLNYISPNITFAKYIEKSINSPP